MIDAVSSSATSSTTSSTSSTTSSTEVLGKEDFLKLLVTQLENQDPLEPTDNTEFVAQLAQFSTLEGITNLNDTMDTVSTNISSMQKWSLSDLIDKSVKYEGNKFSYSGSSVDLGYTLDSDASTVTVSIYDSSGNLVKKVDQGAEEAGTYEISWDGTDDSGNASDSGTYKISISAADANGDSVGTTTYVTGKVSSVTYGSDETAISVGSSTITQDEILEIY